MGRWAWLSSSGRRKPARSRVSSRVICGARARSGPDRPEPVGRRPDRARPAAAHRRAARGLDRHVRRRLPRARARRNRCRPVTSDAQRALVARRILAGTPLNGLGRSARFAGFADALLATLAELESGLLEPEQLDGDLALLYAAYREELDRLGLWDRDLLRRRAVERLRSELDAWDGRPVFAYGFEDLTGAEWGLLEALSGRTEVTVSLPYEPGRAAFASLRRTQEDLAALAGGRIEELPARAARVRPRRARAPRAASLRRRPARRSRARRRDPLLRGRRRARRARARRRRRSASSRRAERRPRRSRSSFPRSSAGARPLETVLGTLGIPFAIEGRLRLGQTPFGQALLALLRFAWQQGGRRDLYAFLRSPFSGFARSNVDFLEGRLRGRGSLARGSGRGGDDQASRRAAAAAARGAPQRGGPGRGRPCARGRDAARRARPRGAAGGRVEPRRPARLRRDRAAPRRARRLACARRRAHGRGGAGGARARRGAARLGAASGAASPSSTWRARARAASRPSSCSASRRGRCRAAATPRRSSTTTRAARSTGRRSARLVAARPGRARPLPLLHRLHAGDAPAHARARGGDRRGQPARAEPVLGRGRGALRPRGRAALDAAAAALAAHLAARGGADRARAAARARAARGHRARRRAGARRRERLGAPARARAARLHAARRSSRTRACSSELSAKTPFNVTELERFADCSSAWFFERLISPRPIDGGSTRCCAARSRTRAAPLLRAACRRRSGATASTRAASTTRCAFLRECLDGRARRRADGADRAASGASSSRASAATSSSSSATRRVRRRRSCRASSRSRSAPSARRPSSSAGSTSATASRSRGRSTGSTSTRSARAGSSRTTSRASTAHSAREIEKELRLQIPLYMLVLRDLVGIEPLGGVYRPLAGERRARGLLRAEAKDDVLPGLRQERLPRRGGVLGAGRRRARLARGLAQRIRAGDVRHDPKGRRLPGLVRPLAHVPGEARMRTAERAAGRGDRGARRRSSSRPAPAPARRRCSSSASRGGLRRGLDVDSLLVITYTERAAGELRARIRARLLELGRHDLARDARRRLDLDDPRLLPAAAEGAPVRRRPRPALPRARRQPGRGCSAARRSRRRWTSSAPASDPSAAAAARDLRRSRAAPDADGRLRDAALGRPRARARARRAAGPRRRGSRSCARPPAASPTTPRRPTRRARRPRRRSSLTEAPQLPERLLDLSGLRARGERAATYEEARKAVEQAALDELALPRPRAAAGAARSASRTRTRRRRIASRRSTSRTCSSARATCCARTRRSARREQLRFRSIMVDEFQDTNRLQCELIDLL